MIALICLILTVIVGIGYVMTWWALRKVCQENHQLRCMCREMLPSFKHNRQRALEFEHYLNVTTNKKKRR